MTNPTRENTPTARAVRASALVWLECGLFRRYARRWWGERVEEWTPRTFPRA